MIANPILRAGAFTKNFSRDVLERRGPPVEAGDSSYAEADELGVVEGWFRYMLVHRGRPPDALDDGEEGRLRYAGFDDSVFYIETKNEIASPLDQFATSFANNGYFRANPVFTFEPSPDEVLAEDGTITYATLSLFLSFSEGRTMPHYLRWYWVDDYATWLPLEYGVPSRSFEASETISF